MQIQASKFNSRDDIEKEIARVAGRGTEVKTKHTIIGTRAHLARLGLSERRSVFGVSCVATDPEKPKKKNVERPNRGEVYPFGINNNLKTR